MNASTFKYTHARKVPDVESSRSTCACVLSELTPSSRRLGIEINWPVVVTSLQFLHLPFLSLSSARKRNWTEADDIRPLRPPLLDFFRLSFFFSILSNYMLAFLFFIFLKLHFGVFHSFLFIFLYCVWLKFILSTLVSSFPFPCVCVCVCVCVLYTQNIPTRSIKKILSLEIYIVFTKWYQFFFNLINWQVLIQMVSKFNSTCRERKMLCLNIFL